MLLDHRLEHGVMNIVDIERRLHLPHHSLERPPPILVGDRRPVGGQPTTGSGVRKRLTYASVPDRKSTRLNSSHSQNSYAVFCLKKKKNKTNTQHIYKKQQNKQKD